LINYFEGVNFSGIAKILTEDHSPSTETAKDEADLSQEDKENKVQTVSKILNRKTLLNSNSSDGELLTDRQRERLMHKSTENVGITTYTDIDEKSLHLISEIAPVSAFKSDSLQMDEYSLDSSSLLCAPIPIENLPKCESKGDEYVQTIRNLQPNANIISALTDKQLIEIQKKVVSILHGVTTSLEKIVNDYN